MCNYLRFVPIALAASATLLGLSGCGDSGPEFYPVTGKLVVKGANRSLEGATVLFESVTDPEVQAAGEVDAEGNFELYSNQGKPGTLEGEHRILIQPPELEYGQNKIIAQRFRSFDESGLRQTVKPGENQITIEVEASTR